MQIYLNSFGAFLAVRNGMFLVRVRRTVQSAPPYFNMLFAVIYNLVTPSGFGLGMRMVTFFLSAEVLTFIRRSFNEGGLPLRGFGFVHLFWILCRLAVRGGYAGFMFYTRSSPKKTHQNPEGVSKF